MGMEFFVAIGVFPVDRSISLPNFKDLHCKLAKIDLNFKRR